MWSEHTATGEHRSRRIAFPGWVPAEVARAAKALSLTKAHELLPIAHEPRRSRPRARGVLG